MSSQGTAHPAGAAVGPCPGTSWELGGCWVLLHRESPHSLCIAHPDYPEHRTTRVFLTILSSKHQAPCGSPVHPCISVYIPPQPWCYLLFAHPRSPSRCPLRLPPILPPSLGTFPLGEHFFRRIPNRDGRGAALCTSCAQSCMDVPTKLSHYSCA